MERAPNQMFSADHVAMKLFTKKEIERSVVGSSSSLFSFFL